MSIPDVVWDGTGKHAAEIVQHLRRDGFAASFAPRRREIHVIGPAGTLHRIHPTPSRPTLADMTAEKGTPEKRAQTHDKPPQGDSWMWISRDAVKIPEVKLGDHLTFDAFGWTTLGVVTRCDEDGITIREERW